MKIQPFKLERYFAKYEFSAPYLLSCSDCEALSQKELLAMADENSLKLWNDLNLGYTESQGHPILREEIAKLYQTIKPEQVLVITPEEGIFIAMNNLLEKGDHVITTFPVFCPKFDRDFSKFSIRLFTVILDSKKLLKVCKKRVESFGLGSAFVTLLSRLDWPSRIIYP